MTADEKLDRLLDRTARIETNLGSIVKQGVDHEVRLRTVEKRVWWGQGAAACVAGLVALLVPK